MGKRIPLRTHKYLVLNYIRENEHNPYITQTNISQELKIHPNVVSKIIAVLLSEREIKVIKVGSANVLKAVAKEEEEDG